MRRGWSLIEVVVSLGIVAVLITIVIPSLQHIRRSARGVECTARLRAQATGMNLLMTDHDDALPYPWFTEPGPDQVPGTELLEQSWWKTLYDGWADAAGVPRLDFEPVPSDPSEPLTIGQNTAFTCPFDRPHALDDPLFGDHIGVWRDAGVAVDYDHSRTTASQFGSSWHYAPVNSILIASRDRGFSPAAARRWVTRTWEREDAPVVTPSEMFHRAHEAPGRRTRLGLEESGAQSFWLDGSVRAWSLDHARTQHRVLELARGRPLDEP